MAKGQKSKEAVIEKILSSFEGAFLYNGNKERKKRRWLEDKKKS